MHIIIAGRFETSARAEQAVQHLIARGFHHGDTSTFFVNPRGQHAQFPVGGDQYADANASRAGTGAVAGAAAGGAAAAAAAALAVPGIGIAAVLGVIAAGAYTGSLAGTLAKLGGKEQPAERTGASPGRPAGVLVAVRPLTSQAEQLAVDVLREEGAGDIERKQAIWEDGQWKDFDPVAPPDLVGERKQSS